MLLLPAACGSCLGLYQNSEVLNETVGKEEKREIMESDNQLVKRALLSTFTFVVCTMH